MNTCWSHRSAVAAVGNPVAQYLLLAGCWLVPPLLPLHLHRLPHNCHQGAYVWVVEPPGNNLITGVITYLLDTLHDQETAQGQYSASLMKEKKKPQ